MKHEIILSPEAIVQLKRLRARDRAIVRDGLDSYLRYEPTRPSRSRIKKLRDRIKPRYRLRLGSLRIYYDVVQERVEILAIVEKSKSETWLTGEGEEE
jgi:mRNA-degrading endonuclease RelE of RelBE toxin-antitoxin system